jgi:hypothetical protein
MYASDGVDGDASSTRRLLIFLPIIPPTTCQPPATNNWNGGDTTTDGPAAGLTRRISNVKDGPQLLDIKECVY